MLCRKPNVLANFALLKRASSWPSGSGQKDGMGQGPMRMFISPAWKAGFVSKSDSYKAWIDSEEAKHTRKASRQT